MLPDLDGIFLEIIFDAPVDTFGLSLLIFESLANGLFVSWKSFLDVHS